MGAEDGKVGFADVLRAVAYLVEHPEEWEGFKAKFGVATARAALALAEKGGVPPDVVAKVRRDIGL